MTNEYADQLKEIRSMMERSSRFISLSGLSGISAGIVALIGAALGWWYIHYRLEPQAGPFDINEERVIQLKFLIFLILDALFVLVFAVGLGIFFAVKRSAKLNLPAWNKAAELTIMNLLIPLVAGGLFCIILLFRYHYYYLVGPSMLIFYGLALLNASKYTLKEVRYLGFCEILLGLIACFTTEYTLVLWAIGFGLLHIVYGLVMYYRYEK